jgi:ABC-2 type transport system ATP-binding protein
MEGMDNAIEARGLEKTYRGDVRALKGVSLAAAEGTVFGLLGPNGAGKSTTVKILTTLSRPDAGEAYVAGYDVVKQPGKVRLAIGAVAQKSGLDPQMSGRENLVLQGRVYGMRGAALHSRAQELLERFGLDEAGDRTVRTYSGGMQRKLDVAVGLMHRPQVLFLDEPTAGMDAGSRRSLLRDVATFAESGGAVLLTTQQLAEAEEIASRVVLLVDGSVALEGSVAAVWATGGATKVVLRAPFLPPLPGVISIDSSGDRHVLLVDDADELVTHLVRSGAAFRELEVVRTSLEDAFVALTTGGSR